MNRLSAVCNVYDSLIPTSTFVASSVPRNLLFVQRDQKIDELYGKIGYKFWMVNTLQEEKAMAKKDLIKGKQILIVDDEPDVLETLEDLLSTAKITTAGTFEEAKKRMEAEHFDIAILDIMGVNGYELLKIANQKKITAIMLTAHAFTPEDTMKSHQEGAALYVPKDRMIDIVTYLDDVLEAEEKGKTTWWRWIDRFADLYDQKFQKDWRYKDKAFWRGFPYA
jgi:CheY-like chemotaxis protein